MVFNDTFNNISVISRRSVLLVEVNNCVLCKSKNTHVNYSNFQHLQEVGGSKTSLILKDDKKTTPKKKVKKKVKKASPRVSDEFMDAAFAADLSTIQEDIVTPDDKKDEDAIPHPYSTESVVLKSQPLENLFIETNCKLQFSL
jgi:hypothetical protein